MNERQESELTKAEQTLSGEALVAAQLKYLNESDRSFPGPLHDEGECDICDSRMKAMQIYLREDDDA